MCSSIHPIISTLLQDLKLTKHWFSSFQWVPLQEGMNEICATFRPPITIFLMAGALPTTPRAFSISFQYFGDIFHTY